MNALVLFRSYHGNTEQVAEAIARRLRETGHMAVVQDLRRALPELGSFDLVAIGAPTRMARVTHSALGVLRRLRRKGFTAKPIVVFDTYGPVPTDPQAAEKSRPWIYPGAAGMLQKAAAGLGLNVYAEVLRCQVKGLKGPLADGELERALSFTDAFASALGGER